MEWSAIERINQRGFYLEAEESNCRETQREREQERYTSNRMRWIVDSGIRFDLLSLL
jgi:hypothetical protein